MSSKDPSARVVLARVGLGARALVNLVVAVLALTLAAGWTGSETKPSGSGALEAISRQPGGRVLVGLVAIGLAAYAGWRFVQGVTGDVGDRDGKGEDDPVSLAKRLFAGVRGVFYAGFAIGAASFVLRPGHSSGEKEKSFTATLLQSRAGVVVVFIVGVVVIGAGLANLRRAFKDDPKRTLDENRPRGWAGLAVRVAASLGLVARTVAYGLVGVSFVVAAANHEPGRADGVDDALRDLATSPGGRVVLVFVATGFAAYAAYLAAQTVWRDVPESGSS